MASTGVSFTSGPWNCAMSPRSAAVSTVTTPEWASAAVVSMPRMRAWAWGLRRTRP